MKTRKPKNQKQKQSKRRRFYVAITTTVNRMRVVDAPSAKAARDAMYARYPEPKAPRGGFADKLIVVHDEIDVSSDVTTDYVV